MRKSALIMPAAAVIAGAAGFLLRKKELATVFDETTGLAARGAPVSTALIALSLAAAIAFVLFAMLGMRGYALPADGEAAALPAAVSGAYLVTALIMLGGTAYYVLNGDYAFGKTVAAVFVLFAALSAAAFAAVPRGARKGKNDGWTCFLAVMPAVFYSLWLVGTYRGSAADPVLLDYCYGCLSLCALALAAYFQAGFIFHKAKPGAAVATGLIAVYLCVVTLADERSVPLTLMLAAALCTQALTTAAVRLGMKKKD